MADDWASREAPLSFKDIEKALREVVFAFACIAIMRFLALREETVGSSPLAVQDLHTLPVVAAESYVRIAMKVWVKHGGQNDVLVREAGPLRVIAEGRQPGAPIPFRTTGQLRDVTITLTPAR